MASFDPGLLPTFLAVHDAGRISAAAQLLHLSQPAVTAQIRKLEDALGTALFVRRPSGVTPTEAGSLLAVRARVIARSLDDLERELVGTRDTTGPLMVAASTTVAAHVLPSLLTVFRRHHREVRIDVHVGNTEAVVAEVRAGDVPLGIVEGHARAAGLRLEPFRDDEIVPVVARVSPYRLRRASDLQAVPILWRERGSGTRAVVERALAAAGVSRRHVRHLDLEFGSTEAILGAAEAGLGVAFVSRVSTRAAVAAGFVKIVPALDLFVRRTFRWVLPSGALTGTAARFYELANATPRGYP